MVRPARGVPGKDFSVEDVRGTFPEEIEVKPLGHPVDTTVRVPGSKSITNRALIVAALAEGPELEDGKMLPPKIANLRRERDKTTLELAIHEGRNRIIRRACKAVGLNMLSLRRVRIGPVRLGDLAEGHVRALTLEELEALR